MQALQEGLFQIKDKVLLETFLSEYGRQRTSTKFHDLVWT